MSYFFYKIVHLFAVLLLFTSLGTLAAAGSDAGGRLRRLAGVAHGVAMAIILVAGFGLLARLGLFGAIPGWAWLKVVLWLLLGLAVLPLRRRPEWAVWLWSLIPIIGGLAAWLAVKKPF
jgi:hypothetical protein